MIFWIHPLDLPSVTETNCHWSSSFLVWLYCETRLTHSYFFAGGRFAFPFVTSSPFHYLLLSLLSHSPPLAPIDVDPPTPKRRCISDNEAIMQQLLESSQCPPTATITWVKWMRMCPVDGVMQALDLGQQPARNAVLIWHVESSSMPG